MNRKRSVMDLASAGDVLPTMVQTFWKGARSHLN